MDSFALLANASLAASRTLLQWLLTCLNFASDSEDLFCWYKKKVIYMNYGSSTNSWKPWRWLRLDLILMMRDIYINSNLNPLTKLPKSSKSTEFKDILLWNISQTIWKTAPTGTRIVINYAMRWAISCWVWGKVNGNLDNNMIKISLATEEINKSKKKTGLWESLSEIQVGKLTIWIRSFEIEKLQQISLSLSVSPE